MADDHHESENLAHLLNGIFSGVMLEQRNEHVFEPIRIEPLFLMVDLENGQNAGILELSESAFHKFEELLFHFGAEVFVRFFVVSQEEEFEFGRVKFVDVLLDFSIGFFPELFMGAVEFFHQVVKLHNFMCFY